MPPGIGVNRIGTLTDNTLDLQSILLIYMVPGAGVEPARGFPRGILSPLRLPISPPGQCAIVNC